MTRFFRRLAFRKIVSFLLMLAMGVLFVSAIQAAQAKDQILKYAIKHADLGSLYPHRAYSDQDTLISEMIFNGLLRYEPGNRSVDSIEGDLAEEVPVPKILSDGRQEWVFKLRRGVMFQPYAGKPGYEVTSEDILFSFKKAADPKYASYASDYNGMTFEAPDKYTFKVIVEKPVSKIIFLPYFSNTYGGQIICKKAFEEKGYDWYKTHPIGTGPFMFKSYTPREKVVLVKHEKYYRGVPRLKQVEVMFMPNLSSRELALQKGEIDVAWGIREQTWIEKMEKFKNVKVCVVGSNEPYILHFNMSMPPIDKLKVRQAIAYALDRDQFIAFKGPSVTTYMLSAAPAGVIPGGLTREEVTKAGLLYKHDIKKAKQLLAEAGYPNGFTLTLHTTTNPAFANTWPLIAAQLKKVGIILKFKPCDHPTWHTMIRKNLNPLVFYGGGRANPHLILSQRYHSDAIVVTGKKPITNFSHIGAVDADGDGKIDNIDALIYAARVEPDADKQIKLWKEAQIKLLKWVVSYPLYRQKSAFATKPNFEWGHGLKLVHGFPRPNEDSRLLPY